MSDRELLELAAKAVSMKLTDNGVRDLGNWEWLRCGDYEWGLYRNNANGTQRRWNPFIDDGDALRLAVKLCIELDHNRAGDQQRYVAASRPGCEMCFSPVNCVEDEFDEPQRIAATRRAIVRAAAEIGRAMP